MLDPDDPETKAWLLDLRKRLRGTWDEFDVVTRNEQRELVDLALALIDRPTKT